MIIQDSRILIKRSTVASEVPTVAPSDDHTDGSWDELDIYKGEFFKNLVDGKLFTRFDSGIAEIAVTPSNFWNIAGNTLTQRQKFGSTSGAYGWDNYVNNSIISGVSNAGKHYWGTNGAYTDTDFSFQGSGNTSGTYNSQWKNSDNTVLGNLKNNGNAFFKSAVFGTDSPVAGSLVTFYGETTDSTAYALRIRDAAFTTTALWRNDGVCQVKNFLVNNDIPNGADLTTDFTVIGRASGDIVHFRDGAYNTVYKNTWDGYHGFGVAPFADTYMSWRTKANTNSTYAWILQNSSSDNLIVLTNKGSFGLNGFSYGGGEGVFFQANASTASSSDPTGGSITEVISGTVWHRLPTGEKICVAGRFPSDKTGDYTILVGDTTVKYTGTGGHTFTLHTAVGYKNTMVTIKNYSAHVLTIDGNSTETIDGNLTDSLHAGNSITLVSDGSNWFII